MAWRVIFWDEQPAHPVVGDCWPSPEWKESKSLSKKYRAIEDTRPPLTVVVPSVNMKAGDFFCVDRKPSSGSEGWDVTIKGEMCDGEPLYITVHPSINCVGSYHGWLKNGIISKDVEGRKYPDIEARRLA